MVVSTREKILNQALELFAENGYHGTSMREIAKAVGIKGSSIYNHFSGKEEIFSELFNYLAPLNLNEETSSLDLQKLTLNHLNCSISSVIL